MTGSGLPPPFSPCLCLSWLGRHEYHPPLPPSLPPGWGGMSTIAGVLLDNYGIGSAYALNLLFMLPCIYLSLFLWRPKAKAEDDAGGGQHPAGGETEALLALVVRTQPRGSEPEGPHPLVRAQPSVSDLLQVEMAVINDSVLRQVPKAAEEAPHDGIIGGGGVSGRMTPRDSGGEVSGKATRGSDISGIPTPEKHHYDPHLVHRR